MLRAQKLKMAVGPDCQTLKGRACYYRQHMKRRLEGKTEGDQARNNLIFRTKRHFQACLPFSRSDPPGILSPASSSFETPSLVPDCAGSPKGSLTYSAQDLKYDLRCGYLEASGFQGRGASPGFEERRGEGDRLR